jgi:hypothetical protein
MKTIIFSIFVYAIMTCSTCFGDTFWGSDFLTVNEAQKKWGISTFKGEKFKNAPEKERGTMATDAIKRNVYVGTDMLAVRKIMGTPNSYFFSDTIYAYKITDPAAKKESWQLIFVPDDKLEKVKEVKIRKKCCYKSPR